MTRAISLLLLTIFNFRSTQKNNFHTNNEWKLDNKIEQKKGNIIFRFVKKSFTN